VTGCNDAVVRLWDIETETVISTMAGHSGWIWSFANDVRDPHTLVSGSVDEYVLSWDFRKGNTPTMSKHEFTGPVSGLQSLYDEQRLVGASFDGTVSVWDWRAAKSLSINNLAQKVFEFMFNIKFCLPISRHFLFFFFFFFFFSGCFNFCLFFFLVGAASVSSADACCCVGEVPRVWVIRKHSGYCRLDELNRIELK